MATLRLSQIQDMVTSTLDDYGPPTFRQVAQRLQRYEIFSRWWKEEKILIQNGLGISRRLMTNHDVENLHTGPMSEDTYDFGDHLKEMRVDWVYIKKPWGFNYRQLIANRGEALLVNVIEPQRANALLNIAHDVESKGWSAPSSSDDTLVPYGVPYWVVKNATQGFNGGAATGHTTKGGINPDVDTNVKNYTDDYDDVSEDDLVFKMNQAKLLTDFMSPLEVGGEGDVIKDSFRCYVNSGTKLRLNKFARSRNDNLGGDIAAMEGGGVMYAGNPFVWVPKLDADTSDPVYMLYHDVFSPVVQEDDFLRESEVMRTAKNHDTYVVWIDSSYNNLCEDPRRQSVIAKQ